MKRTIIAIAVGLVAAVGGGTAYSAMQQPHAAGWPVDCPHLRCVNIHLNQLNERVHALEVRVASVQRRNKLLRTCIAEYPISRETTYDNYTVPFDSNGDGNFDSYNWESQEIDYLSQTPQNNGVDSWILRDTCATAVFGRPPNP